MCSDKCNSIMAIATGLISSLFNVALSGDVPFANYSSSSIACIMVLPKLTFVLVCIPSFLPYRVGDDLRYVRNGFGVRLG